MRLAWVFLIARYFGVRVAWHVRVDTLWREDIFRVICSAKVENVVLNCRVAVRGYGLDFKRGFLNTFGKVMLELTFKYLFL